MAGGNTKRMSADEKRKVILDIYHKTKSVYNEKEILTLASKAGVNANTIADMNQSLVDDCLVDKEKIGGSNYYWSFPAKKDRLMQIQYQKTLAEIEKLKTVLAESNSRLIDAKRGREDEGDETDNDGINNSKQTNSENSIEDVMSLTHAIDGDSSATTGDELQCEKKTNPMSRLAKLRRLEQIASEKAKIEAELEVLKENDPQVLADLEKELKLVHEAANRWTDNIFNCKSYLIKKRNMDKKEANRILSITDDFDYPDDKIPK